MEVQRKSYAKHILKALVFYRQFKITVLKIDIKE